MMFCRYATHANVIKIYELNAKWKLRFHPAIGGMIAKQSILLSH